MQSAKPSKDQIDRWERLTKKQKDEVVGLCLFTKRPVYRTELESGITSFQFVPQKIRFVLGEESYVKEVGGFFISAEAAADPFYRSVLSQFVEITINLDNVNKEFAKHVTMKNYQKEALESLQKKMKEFELEGTKDAKKKQVQKEVQNGNS